MKTLKVPFVKALDEVALSEAASVMELQAARVAVDVQNWQKEYPYKPIVVVDIARGERDLYIHYFVRGLSIRALADKDGTFVHEDSCVEFFVRKADTMNYINFEFNCIGTCYACRRTGRQDRVPLTADEFRSIRRYTTLQREAFAEKTGIREWELTAAIPFELMGVDGQKLPEKMRANFYKCGDKTANPHYVTWNPIDLPAPDYHCPNFFGEITFIAK